MKDRKIAHYLTYRKFNRKLLMLVGWSEEKLNKILFILPYVQLNIGLIMVFLLSRYMRTHCNTLAAVTRSLSVITGFFTISMKMACLINHQKKIFELQEILDKHFIVLLKNKNLTNIILNNIDIHRYLTWSFIFFLTLSTCILIIMPVYTIIYNNIYHIEPNRLLLVYPTSYPWTVPLTGLIFHLHFIFESLATVAIFTITISVDSLFLFYVFLIVGQLREISYCITHVDEKHEFATTVKKCVMQYSILMKCRDNLEKIYGPIILCIMVTNAIVLCTLIYQISQMKTITIIKAVQFMAYILTKSTQTFMYSWCGTQLITESENYRDAIYAADWYGNKNFGQAILIMLKQKPLVLTTCQFSTVSVDMFIKILNTTLSYFFLLKTLETKKT